MRARGPLLGKLRIQRMARAAVDKDGKPRQLWSRRNKYRPAKGSPRDWMFRVEGVDNEDAIRRDLVRQGWRYESTLEPKPRRQYRDRHEDIAP